MESSWNDFAIKLDRFNLLCAGCLEIESVSKSASQNSHVWLFMRKQQRAAPRTPKAAAQIQADMLFRQCRSRWIEAVR